MLDLQLLREHQRNSVQLSIDNDFLSGVHFHATGTGKSWVSFYILAHFYQSVKTGKKLFEKSPKPLVIFWICERKNILDEQFNQKTLRERGFNTFIKTHFNVVNFSQNKDKYWYEAIHSAQFWGKPILVIINRGFLTTQQKYKSIRLPIHLVLHDECHSITNTTTQDFYQWLLTINNPEARCIGFSATPSFDDTIKINPFSKILSKFTIYNACIENDVILPPIIERFELVEKTSDKSFLSYEEVAKVIKERIINQPYKKIVVWAGMIHFCNHLSTIWKKVFPEFKICVDTSAKTLLDSSDYISYSEFSELEEKGILFCACKHREGSDIKNLDTCVFLDYVQDRGHQNFVQCVGRALRKDYQKKKKHGLIIDIKAKSTIKLCDRLGDAFQLPKNIFPWITKRETVQLNLKEIVIHTLSIYKNRQKEILSEYDKVSDEDLISRFTRVLPKEEEYQERFKRELFIIMKKNLAKYLFQAMDILEMANNASSDEYIPHITRGSCGSSLICYLLGISHVDPVKYKISFARFLNECRDSLPDVDFDFPYHRRDSIFLELQNRWPGKIARISNHVHYHEKSARREAIRRAGIKGFIGKHELYSHQLTTRLSKDKVLAIEKETQNLMDKFRCYSLHCGGIVYFENGIPEDLLMKDKNERIKNSTIQQVVLDKYALSKEKRFKIDILSSRGLAQLLDIFKDVYPKKEISFENDNYIGEPKTVHMLQRGDNVGITLAESPLMRKAFMKLKPKTLHDMAICLSIIRPAASQARQAEALEDAEKYLIFDDDAIDMIKKITGCKEDDADRLRRLLSKNTKKQQEEAIYEIKKLHSANNIKHSLEETLNKLSGLRKYSFCKSHAYSYAQLVWYLAFMKANYPKQFWRATLNHCHSSYRGWVHKYEAFRKGVNWEDYTLSTNNRSIYSQARRKTKQKILEETSLPTIHLAKTGFWNTQYSKYGSFFPNCYGFENNNKYLFRGIVASIRIYRKFYFVVCLGVEEGLYIEIQFEKKIIKYMKHDCVGFKGEGIIKSRSPLIINVLEKISSF